MIVAGLGSRKDVAVEDVLAAIRACADRHGVAMNDIRMLATGEKKASETAFAEAAIRLGLPLEILSDERLAEVASLTLTQSERSVAAAAVPSLSEAAALAAAGADAQLLGPRLAEGPVTCALASGGGR